VLIHLIDIHGTDPAEALAIVEEELAAYGAGLDDKPRVVALNKIDLVDAELVREFSRELIEAGAARVFPISGATGKGMDDLLDAVLDYLPAATVTERPDGEVEDAADAKPGRRFDGGFRVPPPALGLAPLSTLL
jgi:GTP-binding protein